MNKNIFIFLAVSSWCVSAFAQERILAQDDLDANTLVQIYGDIISLSQPCMAKEDKTLKTYQVDTKCMCEHKTQFAEKISNYDLILARHPDWKGKIVDVPAESKSHSLDDGGELEAFALTVDTTVIEKAKQTLSECP